VILNKEIGLAALSLLVLPLLAGCGGNHSTAPVSGVIKFKGELLQAGGAVRFVPLGGGAEPGKAAFGTISPEGAFVLSTYATEDGAVLGEHRVEITQKKELSAAKYEGEKDKQRMVAPAKPVPAKLKIPAIYSGAGSPLRVSVTQGMAPLVLELNSDGV